MPPSADSRWSSCPTGNGSLSLSILRSRSRAPHTNRRAWLRAAGQATLAAGAALAAANRPVAAEDEATGSIIGSWIVNAVNPAPGAVRNCTFVRFTPGGGFTQAGITHPTESPGVGV